MERNLIGNHLVISCYKVVIITSTNNVKIFRRDESHKSWRKNLTNSNTMWVDYNLIYVDIWVVAGSIPQLFRRKKN